MNPANMESRAKYTDFSSLSDKASHLTNDDSPASGQESVSSTPVTKSLPQPFHSSGSDKSTRDRSAELVQPKQTLSKIEFTDIKKTIIELKTSAKKNNNYEQLHSYLDKPQTLEQVKSMDNKKQKELYQLLQKDDITARKSFSSRTGIHLCAQFLDMDDLSDRMYDVFRKDKSAFKKCFLTPIPKNIKTDTSDRASGLWDPTPEKCRNTSQPGWFITKPGLNHPKTSSIYSQALLNRMEHANLSEQQKTELLPPVLIETINYNRGISFPELKESSLIFPELVLSESLCEYISLHKEREKAAFAAGAARKVMDPEMLKRVVRCHEEMMNFPAHLPALAELGAELTSLLNEKQVDIPSDPVPDRYSVKRFVAKKNCDPADSESHVACLFDWYLSQQPVHHYLAGYKTKEAFYSQEDTRDILRIALNRLCEHNGSDIRPGSAPVFIGFIPESIANSIAEKSGFLDSNWSANFLHGKYPHAMTLTTLTKLAQLNEETLKTIVQNDLWAAILDLNAYSSKAGITTRTNELQPGESKYMLADRAIQ